ncbi:extracellular solute-binding protein [Oscillospiraceae bacterium HV4-5-C5C]|nr:extracellular solute-binding protein [Oscillospiraceae bacterium HV4-5-C5C]
MEDTFQLPSDARASYLSDMTEMVNGWEDWSSSDGIIDSLKSGVTVDGKVYGVPYNTDTRGLWYNKDILTASGIDAENWAPKTWDDLLNDLRTIKEKNPDIVPLWLNSGIATGEATTMQTYQMLLYGTGKGAETLYKDDKWIVGSQGIIDSLTFIQTVYKEELGPPLSKILDANGSNTGAREYLHSGKAAVELDGNWITGNYKTGGAAEWPEYAEKLGFAPMPNEDGSGTVTLAGGWALAIPEKSDNKDMTFDFITHLMSKDVYTDFIVSSGSICTRQDTAKDTKYTSEPFMDLATQFLSGAGFRPINDDYPAVSTAIQSMVESVVTQKATPEEAMAQFKTDVIRTVGEENVTTE